jgi:hypothetical protein
MNIRLKQISKQFIVALFLSIVALVNMASATDNAATAEEMSSRIINLAKSVKSKKDLSPQNIALQMQTKVEINDQDLSIYGFAGNIKDSTWVYWLTAYPYPSKNNKKTDTIRFEFKNLTDEKADIKAVCAIKPETYKTELENAGFKFSSYAYGIHFVKTGWIFERGKIFVHIYVNQDMSIEPTKVEDRCVEEVFISAN